MENVVIIGGGPSGNMAALGVARTKLSAIVFTVQVTGGQLLPTN